MCTLQVVADSEERIHGQGRMPLLLEEGHEVLDVRRHGLVGDLLEKVGHAVALADFLQRRAHALAQVGAHPDDAAQAAVGGDELLAGQVELAHAHHARRLHAAAGGSGERGEGHAAGRHAGVLAADDHEAVGFWHEHHDALEAATRRHRRLHDGVERHAVHRLVGLVVDELVGAGELALHGVEDHALGHRLVGAGGVDLVARLAVEPVVRAAEAHALRVHDADVVGREALAQQAAVEGVDRLVGERGDALVALAVGDARLLDERVHLGLVGGEVDLHLVDDVAEHLVDARVDDLAEVLQAEALGEGALAHPRPGDVALAVVLDALDAVDEVVELALEDGLEVRLHLAPGDVHDHAERQGAALLHGVQVGAVNDDLAVLPLVGGTHAQVLERVAALAAEFGVHDVLADAFALEGRSVGDGDRHLGDLDLDAAHLHAALDQLLGALHVVVARDLVERHADDVLVGGHAGRQDLRDTRVGDRREAEADGPGRRGVLEVVDLAEGEHEGEHAVLVVEHDLARHAGVHAAKRERRAGGEAQGVHGGDGVDAERHRERVVAELDALFLQLVDDAAPVDVAAEEDEDAAALQLAHDLDRDLVALGAADDGAEPGHAAVHELDAPGPQLDVVDGAVELHLVAVHEQVAAGEALAVRAGVVELDDLRLLPARETHALYGLFGEEGGDAAVQRLAEVRQPHLVARQRVQQALGALDDDAEVAELLDLVPHESEGHGQEVGGVGEGDRRVRAELGEGGLQGGVSLRDDLIGAADGVRGDEA